MTDTSDYYAAARCAAFRLGDEGGCPSQARGRTVHPQQGRVAQCAGARRRHPRRRQLRRLWRFRPDRECRSSGRRRSGRHACAQRSKSPRPSGIKPNQGVRSVGIAEAVESLAYDVLEKTHCGWENSDGAYGDVIFDIEEETITLDYNERYTASENYTHTF